MYIRIYTMLLIILYSSNNNAIKAACKRRHNQSSAAASREPGDSSTAVACQPYRCDIMSVGHCSSRGRVLDMAGDTQTETQAGRHTTETKEADFCGVQFWERHHLNSTGAAPYHTATAVLPGLHTAAKCVEEPARIGRSGYIAFTRIYILYVCV